MFNLLITWLLSEWYHFKKSRHPETFWFGLFAADWRCREIVRPDLRALMEFYVDRGRVEIVYRAAA